ncbi:MAG: hypothetical protein AAF350_09190 [Pseudomonadota bacterium]
MKYAIALAACLMWAAPAWADAETDTDNACLEGDMAQFGRYVGDWKIADESFARDGSGWIEGKGARWIFKCIGDGTAIQDFWMPNGGGWGTNLRTYNPDTKTWEIVWAAAGQKGLQHITARQADDGRMIMDIVKPVPDPPRRIVFYPPDEEGWTWAQQWTFDDGESWFDVYHIIATPYAPQTSELEQ